MGNKYTLTFKNNSTNAWTVAVYQTDPALQATTNALSLAWFAKAAATGTSIDFTWTIDYNFVWMESGILKPGVVFKASQSPAADLNASNKINFTQMANGAFTFANQSAGQPSGSLLVQQDGTIPLNTASVGIGMSNAGTFVVPAQPNINITFSPHPQYWIAFGNYQQGQVLDTAQITAPANVAFPINTYSMTAILDGSNKWTVLPTNQVNARYVAQLSAAERTGDPNARTYVEWGKLE